jgi:hypothetical protein
MTSHAPTACERIRAAREAREAAQKVAPISSLAARIRATYPATHPARVMVEGRR